VETVLESLPPGGRVAVIRLRSLGDCVLTTPALHLLKQARPDLRLAVLVEDRFAPLFEGNPDLDALLPPNGLRGWRPELCLNLHGGTRSMVLAAISGARMRAGFAHFRYSWLLNVKIPRAQEILGINRKVHTAEHLASAMFYLGVPRVEIPRARLFATSPLPAQSAPSRALAKPYAVIHPIASDPTKTWSATGFLQIAKHLKAHLEPVFIAGAGEDLREFDGYRTIAGAPLSGIKSLISGASVFVGNDSGPAHIAAAFGIPVVVLFGSSDPEIWRPWKTPSEVITGPAGIQSIAPAAVMEALERLRVHA